MFGKKKEKMVDPLIQERDKLILEVHRWMNIVQAQVDIVMAQQKMCYLFPIGCPDDLATGEQLAVERTKLRNRVAEYDLAVRNYNEFSKNHPEIRCAKFIDSHQMIQNYIRCEIMRHR